ncbi:MAG TPA: outer membrane beta-barrel protein [Steroidobacteraceae bacterium]|jgi:hypothetical protein
MNARLLRALIPIAMLPAAWQVATAAEPGFYAGIAYSQSDYKIGREAFDAEAGLALASQGFVPETATFSFDTKSPGYGFVVGYRMYPFLAFEGGYLDMGKVSYRVASDGTQLDEPASANLSFNARTSGIAVSALGILPLNYRWEFYGRVGALFATNRSDIYLTDSLSDIFGPLVGEASSSKTNVLVGAGVSFSMLEIYGVRLEYQRAFDVEAQAIGTGDVDLLTLGVTVQF